MEEQSAVSILHSMRKLHEKKLKFIKLTSFVLNSLLLIDFLFIIIFRIQSMNLLAWGGIALLVLALGFTYKELLSEMEWIQTIDDFYLGTTKRLEDGIEGKV